MGVYEVGVRFMRRTQMREYEPAEAEVTMKANLADGEDHMALATKMMSDAKTVALESGLKTGKSEAKVESAAAETKPKATTKTEEKKPAPVEENKKPAPVEEKKPAPAPTPAEADEFADSAPAAAAPMSVKDLQTWVSEQITAKRITREKVMEVFGTFGIARTAESKDGDREAIKKAIEDACSK